MEVSCDMEKNILIICAGNPFKCDRGFGYHVWKVLENMKLPENVEVLEVGESVSMMPSLIEGRDKMIVVDAYRVAGEPGTVVRLKMEDIPLVHGGTTDVPKLYLVETLKQIALSGKAPDTICIGVVPKDTTTEAWELTPEIKGKIRDVIELILKELS
jgi:hydrogenase maturation protease